MKTSVLEVIELGFNRENQGILNQVTLSLSQGECLTVWGPNGCGKSTLLRLVAGFLEPSHGSCQVSCPESFKSPTAFLGHQISLKDDLSAFENSSFMLSLCGIHPEKIVINGMLEEWGLASSHRDKPISSLSAGQRRRVALALLQLKGAALWLLDEPMVALDPLGQETLVRSLNKHLESGGCALITNHQASNLWPSLELEPA